MQIDQNFHLVKMNLSEIDCLRKTVYEIIQSNKIDWENKLVMSLVAKFGQSEDNKFVLEQVIKQKLLASYIFWLDD